MNKLPTKKSTSVDLFLEAASKLPTKSEASNRLIFGLDATASRQPMWDMACQVHSELFQTAADANLSIQLAYYRGFNEFHTSAWVNDAASLLQSMQSVFCIGGLTQINRFLGHVEKEASNRKLKAAVFIGDACEESTGEIFAVAGRLGLLQVPIFVFQEGFDPIASAAFSGIALRTQGAHIPFNPGSSAQLKELLGIVAKYASGGQQAVEKLTSATSQKLLKQLKR